MINQFSLNFTFITPLSHLKTSRNSPVPGTLMVQNQRHICYRNPISHNSFPGRRTFYLSDKRIPPIHLEAMCLPIKTPYLSTYHPTDFKPTAHLSLFSILIEDREVHSRGHILIHKLNILITPKLLWYTKNPYQTGSATFVCLDGIGTVPFPTCSRATRNRRVSCGQRGGGEVKQHA